MTSAIRFSGVSRHYGDVKAVDTLDLDIAEGEFFAMLGPSGSGKTTSLRLIAGFERPTAGEIRIFGQIAQGIPPYKRNVNTVFQDYALFPHLNVRDNVAYGLMIAGQPKAQRHKAADGALEMVALGGYGDRKPSELSGGQRQRVALARALVNQPKALLLDEPLGALDLKLREQMQEELKSLQRSLGITFIFVTHDQGEALSMADRVAVFNKGRIVQIGAPEDIYYRPETPFVADFVGSSNVLPPEFVAKLTGKHAYGALRPESVFLAEQGHSAMVRSVSFLGAATRVSMQMDKIPLTILLPKGAVIPKAGDAVTVAWSADDLHVMDRT
ncbi:ABC transporter ATP-binding protein [Puniceibacterium sediminis]|uniref:Putative spermidine/putrescine transport system ATP-binding protein n=1 Tax=Puniceibacterium sediminis TaxID=1608407 RepID=A0A238WB39_9RHOB|nr:ABC transporter ATP-binding protein [Puniceibacterium sediminis]SNR43433.1 putative spermidine/putrescine transport system ATP-binding protein [Puniceibacterium sediminis]